MTIKLELKGMVFNRLTVINQSGVSATKKAIWECLCECGHKLNVVGSNLKNGNTKSCGCHKTELLNKSNKTHGLTDTHEQYAVWRSMHGRCNNPKDKSYKRYGGRGIRVCDRWRDFSLFIKDMGERPSKKHSIDRINNDGNYESNNCRWSTSAEQAHNTSKTKLTNEKVIYIRSSSKSAAELSNELKVSTTLIYDVRECKVWKNVPATPIPLIKSENEL